MLGVRPPNNCECPQKGHGAAMEAKRWKVTSSDPDPPQAT